MSFKIVPLISLIFLFVEVISVDGKPYFELLNLNATNISDDDRAKLIPFFFNRFPWKTNFFTTSTARPSSSTMSSSTMSSSSSSSSSSAASSTTAAPVTPTPSTTTTTTTQRPQQDPIFAGFAAFPDYGQGYPVQSDPLPSIDHGSNRRQNPVQFRPVFIFRQPYGNNWGGMPFLGFRK